MALNSFLAARLGTEVGVQTSDLFALQNAFVANPGAFGFSFVKDACGALGQACKPSSYLFWDGVDPISGGHALIANAMQRWWCPSLRHTQCCRSGLR